jgi:hypothetical protein
MVVLISSLFRSLIEHPFPVRAFAPNGIPPGKLGLV